MSTPSCVGQQPVHVSKNSGLSECSCVSLQSTLILPGNENPNLHQISYCNMGRKTNLEPSVKDLYMTFEYCSFMFYACFLLNDSVCSGKAIKYVQQGTAQSLPNVHTLLAFFQCIRVAK
jgi:hypothetical protein